MSADLAAVVAAWPTLPEALKAGIVALVKAAKKGCPGATHRRASTRETPLATAPRIHACHRGASFKGVGNNRESYVA
jgi:hypothetical protein